MSTTPQPKKRRFGRKPADAQKKPGRFAQMKQVFTMTRRQDPTVVWVMLAVFLGVVALSLVIGLLINNIITLLIIGIALGVLGALVVLSRKAERAAFGQIEGQPGAAGAALSTLKRGWIVEEQPVAVDPRTKDTVFRVVGRPGIILITEGPSHRARRLAGTEQKRLTRLLPNVAVHVIESGREEGQVPLPKLSRAITKLKPQLTRQEVGAVGKRLSSLAPRLPIPKGIDPTRARPDRRALRGR
ncbi:DUF4191 domain-containing protein [Tersicoccus sp. Bi-70]|uniref:DUF4191 domain-containing protein n=1 Tax=Tersicoccus sp. Bi-70 TaxID=1897634 RepID=UPI0009778599|nr:DUF4191 domain-containing protein [Tersicoccus sp. Bi-70]OMH33186.1 hypothetical protein BGP79_06560 [Tersicoccus sp. Bi-70]